MELTTRQRSIIESKPFFHTIIKGKKNTGKTTSLIYRLLYLKNQYCLYEDDSILMILKNEDKEYINSLYQEELKNYNYRYMSLLSCKDTRIDFFELDDLIKNYYDAYCRRNHMKLELIEENEKKKILWECIVSIKQKFYSSKILKAEYVDFFSDEIAWIKEQNIVDLKKYQSIERNGRRVKRGNGPMRLKKNSSSRTIIFDILNLYDKMLEKNHFIDYEGMCKLALKEALICPKAYCHILLDNAENLTKIQFNFIEALCNNKDYSTIAFSINNEEVLGKNTMFVKNSKLYLKSFNQKVKTAFLKDEFKKIQINEYIKNDLKENFIEKYTYIDIRHKRSYEFQKDYNSSKEIIVSNDCGQDIYGEENLKQIPVYSDIAAGEPILINDEIEGSFYLPDYWMKGVRDCFILKIKGDSMIGAGINDGDFVLIRKQYAVQESDIVAVAIEGNATLKRLHREKDKAILKPENPKYSPITLDENASLIGVAIGVIKKN